MPFFILLLVHNSIVFLINITLWRKECKPLASIFPMVIFPFRFHSSLFFANIWMFMFIKCMYIHINVFGGHLRIQTVLFYRRHWIDFQTRTHTITKRPEQKLTTFKNKSSNIFVPTTLRKLLYPDFFVFFLDLRSSTTFVLPIYRIIHFFWVSIFLSISVSLLQLIERKISPKIVYVCE